METARQTYRTATVSELTPHPANPRQGDVGAIHESIETNGFYGALIVQKSTGYVLAGNHRLIAAIHAGALDIPILEIDVDDDTATRILLADNRTNDVAGYDDDALARILEELNATALGLAGTGYDTDDLDQILGDLAANAGVPGQTSDETPEPPKAAVTEPGEIIELGPHLLACGDATDPDVWKRILADDDPKTALTFTSPPYALGDSIKLRTKYKARPQKSNTYNEHQDTIGGWPELMRGFTANARANTYAQIVNVQLLGENKRELVQYLADNADALVDVAIWDKGHGVPHMQSRILNAAYEFLIVLCDSNSTRTMPFSRFHGTEPNVVRIGRQSANVAPELHAATMPVDLPDKILRDWTPDAKTIVDPFGGTGTTLISADAHGRSARLIEMDPVYCDVIRARYAKHANRPDLDPSNDA